MAGENWYANFMKRNPELPILCRKPTGFTSSNKSFNYCRTVNKFFGKLKELLDNYKFEAHEIWNFHDIGIIFW